MSNALADQRRAYVLLVMVIALWGANWPVMKTGLEYIGPLWFGAARILLGCLCLFALLAAQNRIRLPGRRDLPIVLSVGLLQTGLSLALVHTGLQYVGAGRSAILNYTTPLWVIPLAYFVLRERFGAGRVAGLTLGLCGILILFNPWEFDFRDGTAVYGNALLLASALAVALVIVHIRRHDWELTPDQLMPWQMALGGIMLSALALWQEGWPAPEWTPTLVAVLAYNGPIASAFCFWAFVNAARILPSTSTSMVSLGVPVVGVITSAVVLGEPLTPTVVGGLAAITGGVGLVSLADFRRRRRRAPLAQGPSTPHS